jgi:membrane-associated protease RseP (regulator of RpoE activity)
MSSRFKSNLLHSALFLITLVTTTMAGAEWTHGKSILELSQENFFNPDYSLQDLYSGLPYSICFLMILTAHEFGHYFTAVYYNVKTTLPFYIPLPPLPLFFGTLGAVIKIKTPILSKKQNFDIGIAGPLAGFVTAVGFLWYGFTHLPPPDYIFQFHPSYQQYGLDYASFVYAPGAMPAGIDIVIGKNLFFLFFERFVADPSRIPNVHEIMHYPFLFAGFLSLVFTSMNLLPVGQLDGGHVLYGLIGFEKHKMIATLVYIGLLFYAGIGFISPYEPFDKLIYEIPLFVGFLFLALRGLRLSTTNTVIAALAIFTSQYLLAYLFPHLQGYSGWLVFAFVVGRFVGVEHPPCHIEEPLDLKRKILGWIALLIFILCFTPQPILLIEQAI